MWRLDYRRFFAIVKDVMAMSSVVRWACLPALIWAVAGLLHAVDRSPTIVVPAAVAPSPVTATTAQASVLATDDGGDANIIYTWSGGNSSKKVFFSPNGSNDARNTTVTFTAAGTYTLTATAKDAAKHAVTSKIKVTVVATPTALSISPAAIVLNPAASQTFTLTLYDQFAARIVRLPTISWSRSGGTGSNGTFIAGAPGAGSITAALAANPAVAATASIRINAAPTIVRPASAFAGAARIALAVLGDDDAGEDELTYTWSSSPAGAVFDALQGSNAAKSITATVPADGTYVFTARIADRQGRYSDSAVTVVYPNRAPVAAPVVVTTSEDAAVPVTPGASDPDGDPLVWSVSAGPVGGTLADFDPVTGAVTYIPAPDFAGGDGFTLTVSDGVTPRPVPVAVTVTPVNDAPVVAAAAIVLATDEDVAVSGAVSASDVDGDGLGYVLGDAPGHGTVAVFADGSFSYTPAADWAGTDAFTITVSDGTVSLPVTVTVAVAAVADPAQVTLLGSTAVEGGVLTLVATRQVADNQPLTIALACQGALRAGRDLASLPTGITIPAGATRAELAFPVLDDDLREPAEALTVAAIPSALLQPSVAPAQLEVLADADPILLIDRLEPGYSENGTWSDSIHPGWNGVASRWSAEASASAEYAFDLDASGWYQVQIWAVHDPNSDPLTAVAMANAQGVWTQRVDLTTGSDGWTTMGVMRLAPGALRVSISKQGAQAGLLRADGVRLVPTAAPAAETVLDQGEQGYHELVGTWRDSVLPSPNGGTSRTSADVGAQATWEPMLAPGLYQVSFYRVADPNSATLAQITVESGLGTTTIPINLTNGTSGWVDLGRFPLLAGQGRVTIQAQSNDGPLRADAVRFTALPDDDITITTTDRSYRETSGAWVTTSFALGAAGNPTRYSFDVMTAAARWYAPPVEGDYRVLVYRVVHPTNGGVASLSATDADGVTDLGQLEQKAPATSGWVDLGFMRLTPDAVWPLEIRSVGGSGTPLRTDAIRLVRVVSGGSG